MAKFDNKKKNPRNKGKRDFTKSSDKEAKLEKKGTNDPGWYTLSGQLLHDVASLPFSAKSGTIVDIYTEEGKPFMKTDKSVAGIMRINLIPTYFAPQNLSDPLNLCAADFFAYVRKMNSGSVNYNKVDLMKYLIAMGELYSMYGWLTRIYGLIQAYNAYNKYMPRYLIESMGVDFDDVMKNYANFRAGINLMAAKLGYFSTPKNLPFYARKQMVYTNVYADEDNPKAQLYYFSPSYFLKYVEPGTGTNAGNLIPVRIISNTPYKVNDLLDLIDEFMLPIIHSQDFDIMSGDIRKAFGAENLTVVHPISEDWLIFPVLDDRILDQIHNMVTYGASSFNGGDGTITPVDRNSYLVIKEDMSESGNAGAITMDTRAIQHQIGFTYNTILDMSQNSPSPEEVMEATRLITFTSGEYDEVDSEWQTEIHTCGLETVEFARVFWIGQTASDPQPVLKGTDLQTVTANAYLGEITSAFRKAPYVFFASNGAVETGHGTRNGIGIDMPTGSWDNWTTIDQQLLERMNEACALAMFTISKS